MTCLQIHEIVPLSHVNGPGARACVWVQGCSLACPGCFNPQTHEFGIGKKIEAKELADQLLCLNGIEGITISGGEPLQQPEALMELLEQIKGRSGLSVIIFSGFDRQEIEKFPNAPRLFQLIDAIIAGRYKEEQRLGSGLRGSDNQEIILCTPKYKLADFDNIPPTELVINADGSITISGVDPPKFW